MEDYFNTWQKHYQNVFIIRAQQNNRSLSKLLLISKTSNLFVDVLQTLSKLSIFFEKLLKVEWYELKLVFNIQIYNQAIF